MVSGERVAVYTGDRLEHEEIAHPGDYIFVPPQMPHVVVNRSATTPAVFVGGSVSWVTEPARQIFRSAPGLKGHLPTLGCHNGMLETAGRG